jgi:HK97 family phage portal protein
VFGGVIEVPRDTDLDKTQVAQMLRDLNNRHGGHRKAWIPGALTGGATFKETFMKPADSQLLETEKWIKEQVGDAYGVPAFMQNSTEPGAVSYASSEMQSERYKQSALRPIAVRIETAHKRLLRPGQAMKFNFDGFLRAESEKRWQAYREAWQIGAMNADEIRAKEDQPPLPDGIGKTYWVPLNYAPAEQVISAPLPTDIPGPRPTPEQEEPSDAPQE